MDIDLVKLYLRDTHKIYVLEDMKGPTDLQGGRAFIAKSMLINPNVDEKTLASDIFSLIDEHVEDATAALFAFYKLEGSRIRFSWLTI